MSGGIRSTTKGMECVGSVRIERSDDTLKSVVLLGKCDGHWPFCAVFVSPGLHVLCSSVTLEQMRDDLPRQFETRVLDDMCWWEIACMGYPRHDSMGQPEHELMNEEATIQRKLMGGLHESGMLEEKVEWQVRTGKNATQVV